MKKQFFRIWHRRIGIISLVMILWLAVSGGLINHSDALNLNKHKINLSWLNRLYGLDKSIEMPQAFLIGNEYLFCFQGDLYLNTQVLSNCDSPLFVGLFFDDALKQEGKYWVFLSEKELIVLDENFLETDRVAFSLLGKQFNDLLSFDGQLVLKEKGSSNFWYLDLKNLNLTLLEDLSEGLIKNAQYPSLALPIEISQQLSFPGISLERMLLDAHSGRLFGSLGVLVVDFFALAFVLLGFSGLWIFLKKSR